MRSDVSARNVTFVRTVSSWTVCAGDVGAPVAYPVACSPQAWAAAAPFYLLHTMLGLRADATARRLELIRPTLPEWLGKITISGLPVGEDSVDLLVHRWRGRTSAELLGRRGPIDVIIHV